MTASKKLIHFLESAVVKGRVFAKTTNIHPNTGGQILTSVIVFMAFGLSVVAMSAVLTIINIQTTAKINQSNQALMYAEAGTEEAILQLIRDPAFSGGTFTVDAVSVVLGINAVTCVNPSHTPCIEITSTANYSGFTKKTQTLISLANDKLVLLSWKQVL